MQVSSAALGTKPIPVSSLSHRDYVIYDARFHDFRRLSSIETQTEYIFVVCVD
jgi:hypothetical protein